MRMLAIYVILAAMISGCQTVPMTGPSADIRDKAEVAAQNEKYDLSKFEEPEIKRDTMNGKNGWMFYYEGKMKAPGNHFMVWVSSETEKPLVLHGE